MATPPSKLDQAFKELEQEKNVIDTFMQAEKEMRLRLHDLPLHLAKNVIEGLLLEVEQMESALSEPISEPLSSPRGTNYEKVVAFLRSKGNAPQTRDELVNGARVPRGSLSVILYQTHTDNFEKVKTGQGKILAWKLRNGI